jgi:hypothetical protein
MGTHYEQASPGKAGEPPAHKFPEPPLYPVTHHRRANRTADYKAYLRLGVLGYRTGSKQYMCGQGRGADPPARAHDALELLRAPHPRSLRQHDPSSKTEARPTGNPLTPGDEAAPGTPGGRLPGSAPRTTAKVAKGHRAGRAVPACASNGELLATLTATRGQHGTAGAGTHPLTEAVDLRPPTVIRLERTLAHWNSRVDRDDNALMPQ